MKKLILTSVVAMAMSAGVAQANTGDLQFIGSVSDVTCDIVVENEGVVTNVIQLGTTKPGEKADAVEFALKAADPATCTLGTTQNAEVAWASPTINSLGLGNGGGTAGGTDMTLTATSADGGSKPIKKGSNFATFKAADVNGDGFKFEAQLDAATSGAATVGTFTAAAAFAVAYK
ncbi:fimbrial protein [Escherichia coli]|nr:fimbrial protein [Escherichia coli]EES0968018.1 fimbrial protein [Escherichia coli]EEW0818685.1 fimbrial protein [Escherichia coli]EFI4367786.1 fimbrial protein [Escherichia coli]EFJ1843074.1 fimbrial protein [Escherichia coli]